MEKLNVNKKDTTIDKNLDNLRDGSRWGELIGEAERQIGEAKKRKSDAEAAVLTENGKIYNLKKSIKYFQEQIEAGEPFPVGESATLK